MMKVILLCILCSITIATEPEGPEQRWLEEVKLLQDSVKNMEKSQKMMIQEDEIHRKMIQKQGQELLKLAQENEALNEKVNMLEKRKGKGCSPTPAPTPKLILRPYLIYISIWFVYFFFLRHFK